MPAYFAGFEGALSWVPGTVAGAAPKAKLDDRYNAIFTRVAQGIPIQLLASNAWHESAFDPKAHPPDPAHKGQLLTNITGLGQITPGCLKTFNQLNHYSYTNADMEDPEKNSMVAAWLFRFIVDQYKKSGTATLATPNWDDPNWVSFVLLGYGGGYSPTAGVIRIVKEMEAKQIPAGQITPANARLVAMKLFPKSHIYNNGGGQWSDPALLASVAVKLRDYLALRKGLTSGTATAAELLPAHAPPGALQQLQQPAFAPAVAAVPAPPAPSPGGGWVKPTVIAVAAALAVGLGFRAFDGAGARRKEYA